MSLAFFKSGILKLDSDLVIRHADEAFLRTFNYRSESLIDLPFESLIHARDSKGAHSFHKKLSMYSSGVVDIYPVQLGVGKTVYLTRLRIAQSDESWVVLVEKIEDESGIFHELHRSEMRWKAVSQTLSDGIVVLSEAGSIVEFNHAFFSMMEFRSKHGVQFSEEALYRQDLFLLFQGELPDHLKKVLAESRTTSNASKIVHNGWYGKKYFSVEVTPLYVASIYCGCAVTVKDQTLNTEIAKLNEEIEIQRLKTIETSKMAALGQMAGGVAHEINTPLAIISMRVEQLEESISENSYTEVDLKETLMIVRKTTDRIAKIVKGLRFFARGEKNAKMQNIKLVELIDETLAFCRERFLNHGVDLFVENLEKFRNSFIECRPVEISQVLLNLLNNALDAAKAHPEKWVRIAVLERDESIEFSVIDSGPGIPLDVRDKLMQPFFTTKEIGVGTGLGLSISKGIVEAHDGTLALDVVSPNTRFSVVLPKKQKTMISTAIA